MQFIKALLSGDFFKPNVFKNNQDEKVRVGIIGTGKIGADLLAKVQRSPFLECVLFAGRNLDSAGMSYAAKLGVKVSDKGINAFLDQSNRCDIVFDATSAAYHKEHAKLFEELGILAIDMTPSQIGECCVPALGMQEAVQQRNISMISCGGQSSIPVAHILAKCIPDVKKISVSSIVSANSIGPGTLANIDEYYRNTKAGLQKYTGVNDFDVELHVDEVNLETRMFTSVTAWCDAADLDALHGPLNEMLMRIQRYVPGYRLESSPLVIDGGIRIDLSVEGLGDYLPKYAGNLDIINCAAIAVAEHYAKFLLDERHAQQVPAIKTGLQMEY
ncbi:MAG TPA: acetylating acetaldehyde dehydrogenase [Cellvibrio sp.]